MHRSGIGLILGLVVSVQGLLPGTAAETPIHLRANQVGYLPGDPKVAVAFGEGELPAAFQVVEKSTGRMAMEGKAQPLPDARWGQARRFAELDFSALKRPGRYLLRMGGAESFPFEIGDGIYDGLSDRLLEFMRQQRCGFNPWLNAQCHQHDGRTAYGPLPPGTAIDARGGWHDAGDLLKYLLTSGNATAQMLLAWQLHPAGADRVDREGKPGPNGLADLLDEARWGLEWMLKLHPAPDQLYHQVADDRDHAGWRLPPEDKVDYGWGKGAARVVYAADGRPQGLAKHQSRSTGIANLAGRYAAAMALASQIWKDDPAQACFAGRCLQAGIEVYRMGQAREGVQQGNSYLAPYRYEESTWADDMEWGAAELHRATGETRYLADAVRYARLAGADTWMGHERTGHYQYYPFFNAGHFRLHDLVGTQQRAELADYYRQGMVQCQRRSGGNPYRAGVPFLWCSNNLTVALATQGHLYRRMTGDGRFQSFTVRQRDWLLGCNPWGTTMFTGIGSRFPGDVHLITTRLARRSVAGGLVDGPVARAVFESLKGVSIALPDPLAPFQDERAVYHDDFRDYSTNEPTMDGTASAILLWASIAR